MSIYGNMVGGTAPIRTVTIVDEIGNEMIGVVVENEVLFTAKDNDVREGMVYAGDSGVSVGTLKVSNHTPETLSCTFTKVENFISEMDKYTLNINGLNTSSRYFIIISCKASKDASTEDIIMLRRTDLNMDFIPSIINSTYNVSSTLNVGENQIEIMLSPKYVDEFIIITY